MKLTPKQQQSFNEVSKDMLPTKPMPKTEEPIVGTTSQVPPQNLYVTPKPFGAYSASLGAYPNDVVQLDIYNDQDFYFESVNQAGNFTIKGSDLTIDLEKELQNVGYESGEFKVAIRLIRNYLGSAAYNKLIVQEVSSDRLEVRLIPAALAGGTTPESQQQALQANLAFEQFFSTAFFDLEKQSVLANLYLFADSITSIEVNDYIQDRFTITNSPYSIVFKLNQQLPLSVGVNSLVWIAQEINPAVTETVIVYPKIKTRPLTKIKGPNFDIVRKKGLSTNTEYLGWDEILASNTRPLTRTLLSQSLVEGIQLNVDYTRFENFVKFSSAYERIKNFEYKVKLIESYQDTSASLAASNASESFYVQAQLTSTLDKIDAVVGAFDGYERYMYFESSSYVTNSFGESLDMAWPKSTSTRPYTLYGSDSATVETWLTGILESASLYDNVNPYSLRKLVPEHIHEEQSQVVDSFINMLGHFFDVQYEYINQMPKIHDRQQKLTEGFAKDLVYYIAQTLGVDFDNGDNFQDLWSYTLGLNSSGSYDNILNLSGEDRTKELWKRIINNLPYLLKTKGTERGIRALINCFGIPSTILRVREFGGPEPDLDTVSRYKHDRFYYATNVGPNADNVTYATVQVPWRSFGNILSLTPPSAFSFRYKPDAIPDISEPCAILERVDNSSKLRIGIKIGQSASVDYATLALSDGASNYEEAKVVIKSSNTGSNIFDSRWMTFYVQRDIASDNVNFYVGHKSDYAENVSLYSASIKNGSTTYATSWTGNFLYNELWFPVYRGSVGSTIWKTTTFGPTNYGSGSLQEVRLWTGSALGVVQLKDMILNPTTYAGLNYEDSTWAGSTSSYDDLLYRVGLGTDNKKINYLQTSSFDGQQPKQTTIVNGDQTTIVNPYPTTASQYTAVVETNYMAWPDIAGNRQVGNKVRIDSTINTSEQLYRNVQTQKSLQDNQPVDSPRLGVYLSPTDQANEDIAEQLGGITLDDYIGSYNDIYENSYQDLEAIRRHYLKKVTSKYNTQTYIRLLQYFNASLFTVVKQLVPYRANLQTGLVIEPDLLTRSKVKTASRPTYQDEYYETTLDLPSTVDPFGDIDIIDDGVIEYPEIVVIGDDIKVAEGTVENPIVGVSAKSNEYNNYQVPSQGRKLSTTYSGNTLVDSKESLEDAILTYETSYGRDRIEGSQYEFYTWYTTGSGTYTGFVSNSAGLIYAPSIGEDYSNPIAIQVYDSRLSEVIHSTYTPYKDGYDLLRGSGSRVFTSIEDYISNFGFVFGGGDWNVSGTGLLDLSGVSVSDYFKAPVLSYDSDPNMTYTFAFTCVGTGTTSYQIQFGSGSSQYEYTGTISPGTTLAITSKAANNLLYFKATVSSGAFQLDKWTMKVANGLRDQYQDYMVGPLASIGQRNQKYDGCKLTAPDFNEDSPDTIDGGPVILITEGPVNNLNVQPTQDGTYTFK